MKRGFYRRVCVSRLLGAVSRSGFFVNKKSKTGWSEFAQMKVVPEYAVVDKKKKQVTAVLKHEGKVYLTVTVDIARNTVKAEGSLKKIKKVIQPFTKRRYMDMIEEEARFLVNDYGAENLN